MLCHLPASSLTLVLSAQADGTEGRRALDGVAGLPDGITAVLSGRRTGMYDETHMAEARFGTSLAWDTGRAMLVTDDGRPAGGQQFLRLRRRHGQRLRHAAVVAKQHRRPRGGPATRRRIAPCRWDLRTRDGTVGVFWAW